MTSSDEVFSKKDLEAAFEAGYEYHVDMTYDGNLFRGKMDFKAWFKKFKKKKDLKTKRLKRKPL